MVTVLPPFGKELLIRLAVCSLCIMSICNVFPFWFRRLGCVSDCYSSWSLLTFFYTKFCLRSTLGTICVLCQYAPFTTYIGVILVISNFSFDNTSLVLIVQVLGHCILFKLAEWPPLRKSFSIG